MGTTHIGRRVTWSVLAATLLMMAGGTVVWTAGAQEKQRSLYDRLGGVYSIATVVDDFIERLLVNRTLNANPAINEARARVPKAGLKFQVTALVCEVTGGPCTYHGRAMKESHAHLNITAKEWDRMVAVFQQILTKHSVPAAETAELLAIVDSTKADIVMPSSS